MRLFRWTRARSVFIPEFDAEHRNLHQIADSLNTALSAGAPLESLVPSVRAFIDAAEDHFSHEERMMRAAHYPLFNWHKRQHDTARNAAMARLARMEAGDPQAVEELLDFLSGWLKDHLAVTDRMMAAAVRAFTRYHAA